jgi:hypothetical protein
VLGVLCNYKKFIKAPVFMDEKQENKKSLWDSIRGLVDAWKNGEEKKEKDPKTLFSFWCKIAKDEIEEMDEEFQEVILQKNELAQALLDLNVYYNQAKKINEENNYKISKLVADKKTLEDENRRLQNEIRFLKKNHELKLEDLELQLKQQHQRTTPSKKKLTPPST